MQTAALRHEDLSDDLRLVRLSGRLDMLGMEEIALRFTSLTAAHAQGVIVDLQEVTFLASIGIRSIISSARALERKGGRMVLVLGDNEVVRTTLSTAGIDEVIPMVGSEAEALAALRS